MKQKKTFEIKPADLKDSYYQDIIVKPAKRLLSALIEAEEKEISIIKKKKASNSSSR